MSNENGKDGTPIAQDSGRIQCHFISNTHWDREWRFSAQRTRHMLVYMMDMLLDIFAKEPEFRHFHMDSQTMPIQDYLEVRPEKAELIKKYVTEGRLAIGPWFCLPDEYCVGGESLVRNLLLGHRMAKEFGGVSKTGYSPFGWGQISQMPQIYKGFGIDMMCFYRGINPYIAPKSEFIWEAPDGTAILASRLGRRPRYNVWYIVQRPAYFNQTNENNRAMSWRDGGAPFCFADMEHCDQDYQYAHPAYEYHAETIPARAEQAIREQDDDWSTRHRFWSAGHDSSCPDIREARMIADCDRALGDTADVFHSTFKAFQDGILAEVDWDKLPRRTGEMHHPFTKGSVSGLLGWVTSARTPIKQENFRTEKDLMLYAEPMAVFASLMGAPYPQSFIDLSYNYLLQNHGHDSIGACGRDIVYDDVVCRFRQSHEISLCVLERAFMDIAGGIQFKAVECDSMALVVYNPSPFRRTEVINAVIDIPLEWKCPGFMVLDENGNRMSMQVVGKSPFQQVVQSPNDTANTYDSTRYTVRLMAGDVPAMGYRAFIAVPDMNTRPQNPQSLITGMQRMENEHIAVTINSNGTLDIADKATGRQYKGLGYFRDTGETGSPWEHIPPQHDTMFTTLNERAEITLINDGELEAVYSVKIAWSLPEGRTADEKARSVHRKPFDITNTVTLKKGARWVEVVTEFNNQCEDHYLQVSFPTGIKATNSMAQGQFDVVARPVAKLDYTQYDEIPITEQPMNSFVDMSDGAVGLTLLNDGLKAYEAHGDGEDTVSLTLLRCFPLRICVTTELLDYSAQDKGSQCIGKQSFRYAVMPHAGDWEQANVWQAAERFTGKLLACQIGITKHGVNPLSHSFLELKVEGLHVSAIKRSESGLGWVVRVFNPSDKPMRNALRLNGGNASPIVTQSPVERLQAEFKLPSARGPRFNAVHLTNLEEVPQQELAMDADGWVDFEITGKKILTFEFIN